MSTERIPLLQGSSQDAGSLTPAASEALRQSVESYRQQLLRESSRVARGSGKVIRSSDIESALSSIGPSKSATRGVAPLRTLFTVLLAAVALTVQIVAQITGSIGSLVLSVGSIFAGAAAATATVIVVQERRKRTRRASASAGMTFVSSFAALEDLLRERSQELLGEVADTAGLGRVISAVELMQLWTPEDSQIFRRILSMRNALVHEETRVLPPGDVIAALAQMARLSSLLSVTPTRGPKVKFAQIKDNRAALVFEERIASTLRGAGFNVVTATAGAGYDFLVSRNDRACCLVAKYRHSGPTSILDVSGIVERAPTNLFTILVTNTSPSAYVTDYLSLPSDENPGKQKRISLVVWTDSMSAEILVDAVEAALVAEPQHSNQ